MHFSHSQLHMHLVAQHIAGLMEVCTLIIHQVLSEVLPKACVLPCSTLHVPVADPTLQEIPCIRVVPFEVHKHPQGQRHEPDPHILQHVPVDVPFLYAVDHECGVNVYAVLNRCLVFKACCDPMLLKQVLEIQCVVDPVLPLA